MPCAMEAVARVAGYTIYRCADRYFIRVEEVAEHYSASWPAPELLRALLDADTAAADDE